MAVNAIPAVIPTTGELVIDLRAIVSNWRYLNQHICESVHIDAAVKVGAVVKADAYGLGVAAVAQALFSAGCTTFFVATLAEAKELRACLCELDPAPYTSQIIVLGGLGHDVCSESGTICLTDWADYQLTPVLFTVDHVQRWIHHNSIQQQAQPCVIKVDTGMHRLGIQPHELEILLKQVDIREANPAVLMSHFACADEPSHPLNQRQIKTFNACVTQLKTCVPDILCSLCNSAGVFLPDKPYFDLVRPGIALYGSNPSPVINSHNPMQAVVQLRLPVMQIKTIAEGETVGYGAEFIAQRETRIAIVFGGYADGLLRSLGNNAYGFYQGQKVPLVGRVSMDSIVFDISDVGANDNTQPHVTLFGAGQTLDDLAGSAGTIAYELLTSLGIRYQRRYISA